MPRRLHMQAARLQQPSTTMASPSAQRPENHPFCNQKGISKGIPEPKKRPRPLGGPFCKSFTFNYLNQVERRRIELPTCTLRTYRSPS